MDEQLIQVEIFSGGDDADTIRDRCHDVAVATADLGLTNHLEHYEAMLSILGSLGRVAVVPVADILNVPATGKINVALRHDIDADIVTAIACATKLTEAGLPGSFYLLHTSHYYGIAPVAGTRTTQLTRHQGLEYFLKALKETAVEIGIHNDALGLIIDHGIDGCRVLRDEIAWLRGEGLTITGSVAHNSAAVYGAECFEIFAGLAAGDRKFGVHNGCNFALQQLDAAQLGLTYEANFPKPRAVVDEQRLKALADIEGNALHTPSWQRQYFVDHPIFERGYDYDIWLVGKDQWLLAGRGEVQYPLTLDQVSVVLRVLPLGSRVVISIHPIYVSQR